MIEKYEIIVVGGGIVGLSSAIAMAKRGFKVALIDALELTDLKLTKPVSRVYALNKASQIILKNLDVFERLDKQQISYYKNMYVWDKTSKAHIEFNAKLIGENSIGAIVAEDALKSCLLEVAKTVNVRLIPNQKVSQLQVFNDSIELKSEDKHHTYSYKTNLLIAADGPLSHIRNLLNIKITSWPYNQVAFVANVETEKSHEQCAYQVFTKDGTLAFLPLVDEYQSSIVWSVSKDKQNYLKSLTDLEFIEELNQASEFKLGKIIKVTSAQSFPLYMRHAQIYADKNWLLVGDAAHSIHPLAGLGLNVGLNDLCNFLKILDEKPLKPWSKSLLGKYQRQRKHAVWQIIGFMEGIKALFLSPLTPIRLLRGFGLKACNNSKILKRFFINQANQ